MMRRASIWLTALCLIIPLMAAPFPAFADEVETPLFSLDAPKSIVFTIEWDTEEPSFALIAPNGRTINAATAGDDVAVVKLNNAYMILIRDAAAGSWRLRYDKGANESIDVMVDEYMEGFWITEYDVGTPSSGMLPVSFMVAHDRKVTYSFTLSLSIEEGEAERTVYSGTASTNERVSLNVSLHNVNSYDRYVLKLYVSYEHAGAEYFDLAYSDVFAYINENTPGGMSGFDLAVNERTATMTADWRAYIPHYADDVLVTVYESGSAEPVFFQSFQPDQTNVSIPYNPQAEWTRIELRWRDDGLLSEPVSKTVRPQESFRIIMDVEGDDPVVRNSRHLSFQYAHADGGQFDIAINGYQERIALNGTGEKWFELAEGYNTISYTYTDTSGVKWSDMREVYVDVTPPMLEVFEPFDGISTQLDTFMLTGRTDPNASLTVNGTKVELQAGGRFIAEIALVRGDNPITLTATDPAGNASVLQGVIHREGDSSPSNDKQAMPGNGEDESQPQEPGGTGDGAVENDAKGWTVYWPLIASLVIAAGLSAWAILTWRSKQHKNVQQSREEVL